MSFLKGLFSWHSHQTNDKGDHAPADFRARFLAFKKQAEAESAVKMERWRALVEGRERTDDIKEIAQAHYWLGQHYSIDGELGLAVYHAREALSLYDKLGLFQDEHYRKRYVEWMESLKGRTQQ
jgi:hypothetical protein